MPIATLPTNDTKPIDTIPVITAPVYQGAETDTKQIDYTSLMPYIEGSTWVIKKYYSQILFKDSALQSQSLNASPTLIQYKSVENLEVKVTTTLSSTQDPATKEWSTTGGAIIFPGLIPNKGDVFLADVGDGRLAIFTVTQSENKSIQKETAHYVEYVVTDYAIDIRLSDLETKTVARYTYMKENFIYGKSPLIISDYVPVIQELKKQYYDILNQYPKIFRSNEVATLVVPHQSNRIYDPFLTNAFMGMFKYDGDKYEINKIKSLNLNDDYNYRSKSLWDAINSLNYNELNYAFTQYFIVSARDFSREGWYAGVSYSGVEYVIYPSDPVLDFDMDEILPVKTDSTVTIQHVAPRINLPATTPLPVMSNVPDATIGGVDTPVVFTTLTSEQYAAIVNSTGIDDPNIPDIYNVTKDNYYVLSEAFYKFNGGYGGLQMSKLEIMVCQMLRKLPVDKNILLRLCNTYHYWGAVERFYYTPILLAIIKYTLRNY